MSVEILGLIIFGVFFLLLALGFPVSFTMLAAGAFGYLAYRGISAVSIIVFDIFSAATTEVYLAIPMFIFMALIFDKSGIGDDMFDAMYKWFGGFKGGLAMAVIAIGALLACVTGLVATATVMMGMIAYPQMAKRGYNKRLAIGAVLASGILGPIIPPSISMIIVGGVSGVSIGKLFFAGIIPGLLAALLFVVYIVVMCYAKPDYGPPLPIAERVDIKEKLRSTRGLVLPIILALVVLGGLFAGAFTATEAGAIGAAGALIIMAFRQKFSLSNITKSVRDSSMVIGNVLWILIGGTVFASAITITGFTRFISEWVIGSGFEPNAILIAILIVVFIEGLALDIVPVAFSNLPIFMPIIISLGIDPLWFVFLFGLDCIIGILTPPFGGSLFFFQSLNFKGVTTSDIFAASVPWTMILVLVTALCVIFPPVVTFLPNMMK